MISAKRGITLLTETTPERQTSMIDALTEEDAKYLLKIAMRVIRGEDIAV